MQPTLTHCLLCLSWLDLWVVYFCCCSFCGISFYEKWLQWQVVSNFRSISCFGYSNETGIQTDRSVQFHCLQFTRTSKVIQFSLYSILISSGRLPPLFHLHLSLIQMHFLASYQHTKPSIPNKSST